MTWGRLAEYVSEKVPGEAATRFSARQEPHEVKNGPGRSPVRRSG